MPIIGRVFAAPVCMMIVKAHKAINKWFYDIIVGQASGLQYSAKQFLCACGQ